jgi:hypothetical protein
MDCNNQGGDGCETKVSSDPSNCGKCGMVCPTIANGVAGCLNAVCTIDHCNMGFADCNGDPSDGCETNTLTNPQNCGNCSSRCPTVVNGSTTCMGGTCVLAMCDAGFGTCITDSPLQGCETNFTTDIKNCGGCNQPCTGTQKCVSGKCM